MTFSSQTLKDWQKASNQGRNSILIKLNQIGTLTETFEAINMAKHDWLDRDHQSSKRRNRGFDYRRPRRRFRRRTNQNRFCLQDRQNLQV